MIDRPNSRRSFLTQIAGASTAVAVAPLLNRSLPTPSSPLPPAPTFPDESYWERVKAEFLFPPSQMPFNAANMCPNPRVVIEAVEQGIRDEDRDVSYQSRAKFDAFKEKVRRQAARLLGATEDEVAIVRNATEANNVVIGGLSLRPGDEVLLLDQNHPSNNVAWDVRAARFGFTVKRVSFPTAPTSADEVLAAFRAALTDRTRVLSFSDVSNTTGLRMPSKALCSLGRERGLFVHVDGAQTLGVLDQTVADLGCDSFSASSQKWLMGPREAGFLYVRADRVASIWPSVVGQGWGNNAEATVKGARKFEIVGQRNDATLAGLSAMLDFQEKLGRAVVERRVRELADRLIAGLEEGGELSLVTPKPPELRLGVVVVRVEPARAREVHERLYRSHGVIASPGSGLRLSPHVYNTLADVDRVVRVVRQVIRETPG